MNFYISGVSDVGIKKSINQDCFYVCRIKSSAGPLVFAGVFDGMGGMAEGEVASSTLMDAFKSFVSDTLPLMTSKKPFDLREVSESIAQLLLEVNERIRVYGEQKGITLGTTVTAVLISEKEYLAVNVGDSRLYEVSSALKQITKDHSFVQEEVDAGRMTPQEAKTSKQQNVLTQCIGIKEQVFPDFYFGKVKKNTTFLLCSDGFRHKLEDKEIINAFSGKKIKGAVELKKATDYLIGVNKERYETDNITAVAVAAK